MNLTKLYALGLTKDSLAIEGAKARIVILREELSALQEFVNRKNGEVTPSTRRRKARRTIAEQFGPVGTQTGEAYEERIARLTERVEQARVPAAGKAPRKQRRTRIGGTAKKLSWTQTPEGRKKMSESMKRRWASGEFKNKKGESK